MSEIRVEGLAQLERNIEDLARTIGDKQATGIIASALRATANIVKDAAKQRVPVKTGMLRDSLVVRKSRTGDGDIGVDVSIKSINKKYANNKKNRRSGRAGKKYKMPGMTFYAYFIERGTSKMRAQPFIRPAIDATKTLLPIAFQKNLAKAIERKVKRMRK